MKKTIYFSLAFISCLCFAILKLIMSSIFISFQNLKLKRKIAIVIFVLVSMMTESNAQNYFAFEPTTFTPMSIFSETLLPITALSIPYSDRLTLNFARTPSKSPGARFLVCSFSSR